jgi:ABC-type sugar transport system substrate-binding protein
MKILRRRRLGGRRALTLGAAVAATALALTACSGVSKSEAPAAAGGEGGAVVDAMAPVTEAEGPTEAFKPPAGKHILILVCGSAGQGCVDEANETKKVAESLGWKVDLVDGKLDPTVWNQAVSHAVDTGVDGIIAVSADPNLYADAMRSVAAKDVPFVLTNQTPVEGDVQGIDSYLAPDPVKGGHDVADWIIKDSDGKANVLLLDLPGYHSAMTRTKTIADDLASKCDGCTVTKRDVSVQTMGTSLAPMVTSQLQQNTKIDYVWSPDDCCASFIQQGIQQAGRTSSIKVVSMGGFPDQLARIETGQLTADLATATLYTSWLSVDSLARLMGGLATEKYWPVPQRLWTPANLDEAPDGFLDVGWNTDFDYQAKFKEMWGTK